MELTEKDFAPDREDEPQPSTQGSGSSRSTLRNRLERELRALYSRADKISEVLKDLTPEMEKQIEVQEKLNRLEKYPKLRY